MFPSMDRELRSLYLGDGSLNVGVNITSQSSDSTIEGVLYSQTSEQKTHVSRNASADSQSGESQDGPSWVDIFVLEMRNAADWSDIHARAMKILESFEKNVVARTTAAVEHEISSLKDQLQCLSRDNQILKRAVSIQHERNTEHEERIREVQNLKHVIVQYQEQVRALEMSNYTLKIHLQKAQETSSMPGSFHPDIF